MEKRKRLLDQVPGRGEAGEHWLLAGTGPVRRRLLSEAAEGGLEPGWSVLGLDEAADLVVRQSPGGPRLLRRGEPVLIITGLLRRHVGELPYLGRFVAEGPTALEGIAAVAAQALRRLLQVAFPAGDSLKLRDLRRLSELRNQRFSELGVEERFERLERAAALIESGEFEPPSRATLLLPDHLTPAQRRFTRALGEVLRLDVVFEPELDSAVEKPSTRCLAPTQRLLTELFGEAVVFDETRPGRDGLIDWLFDGAPRPEAPPEGVTAWRAVDPLDEVRRVVREIKRRCAEGEPAERFVVAVPELAPYTALLSAEFAERGVPFKLPAGESLSAGTPAQVVRALFDLLQRPGRAELHAFLGHPALTPPRLPEPALVRQRLAPLAQYLPPAPPDGDPATFWTSRAPRRERLDIGDFDLLARKANLSGLPRGWEERLEVAERLNQAWLIPVLNRLRRRALRDGREESEFLADEGGVERVRLQLFQLVAVIEELERIEGLRDPGREAGGLLEDCLELLEDRGFTHNLQRRLLTRLYERTRGAEPGSVVIERRRAEAVSRALLELRSVWEAVRGVAEFARVGLGSPLRGVEQLRRLVEEELAARSVRIPGPDAGVTISDLAGLRGWAPREVFVLGLINEAFPARNETGLVGRLAGELDAHDESLHLLARLLRRAEAVHLSFPGVIDAEEARPAPPVDDLLDLIGAAPPRHPDGRPTSPEELLALAPDDPGVPAVRRETLGHCARRLAAADESGFTVYEGAVDPALLPRVPGADERGEVPVTSLEDYLACPRSYYFSRLLGLAELPRVRDEAEASVIGTLTHRALEFFFAGCQRGGRWILSPREEKPVSADSWSADCERMLDCAARAFVEAGLIDPADSPGPAEQIRRGLNGAGAALDAQRRELVDGLEEPERPPPFGVLKGALYAQRELIGTLPKHVEFAFGGREGDALELGELRLRGRIDRLDHDPERDLLAVYDYKTSSPNRLRQSHTFGLHKLRNLQLPLYALAARRHFDGTTGLRAAVINLHEKSYNLPADDPAQLKYNAGVLHEMLALTKAGKKTIYDPAAGNGRLELFTEITLELLESMRRGVFHPLSTHDEKTCSYCPYGPICDDDFLFRRLISAARERGGELDGGTGAE